MKRMKNWIYSYFYRLRGQQNICLYLASTNDGLTQHYGSGAQHFLCWSTLSTDKYFVVPVGWTKSLKKIFFYFFPFLLKFHSMTHLTIFDLYWAWWYKIYVFGKSIQMFVHIFSLSFFIPFKSFFTLVFSAFFPTS